MKFILVIFIVLSPLFASAQQSDSQLAYTYYQNKEYGKAATLFMQLYERTRSSSFLDYYIICLINGKEYDQAEEALRELLKADNNNKEFLVNLGYIYEQQGKIQKSEECYTRAIKKLIPQSGDITNLAYKFQNIREYGWAIKTYQRGRELLKQPEAFLSEMGENYMLERDYENMLVSFFAALRQQPTNINIVTSKLSFARSYDMVNNIDNAIEKKLTEIFKQPECLPVFYELAIWFCLQKQDFTDALKHAIVLNEKQEEKLHLFLNVANSAGDAQEYNTAISAYNKLLAKGKEKNNFYTTARKEVLKCEYLQYKQAATTTAEQYKKTTVACEQFMKEYGYNTESVDIAMLLSDIYAYQLNLPDSANLILEKCINIRGINFSLQNQLKFKRADLLTFTDNLWEATILYTQIEKANPNNDIGYEAKLKKAWLAYYAGDLLWARAQFDVLKGSTSKLISNDAIKMAHFINNNYEEDNNAYLEKLAKTEYLIFRQQYDIALPILDSLSTHGGGEIADHANLQKADLLIRIFRYPEATDILRSLKEKSEQAYVRAETIFKLAELKNKQKETAEAKELYKLLVSEYSGSVYSIEAARLYREMK